MYFMQHPNWKREKNNKQKMTCFDVVYGIFFTREKGVFNIFNRASHSWIIFHIQRQNINYGIYIVNVSVQHIYFLQEQWKGLVIVNSIILFAMIVNR